MFARLSVLALSVFAAATTAASVARDSTPSTVCCMDMISSDSPAGSLILSKLGMSTNQPDTLIGLSCSPATIVGAGPASGCSGTTVSCSEGVTDNIGVGCMPITL
ncbi:hypothetical protein BC629DRAFT_938200 [Irpex lacteus]|nr:hypothetical protein BC629DRAFT_938200 [Irpex lacteus]